MTIYAGIDAGSRTVKIILWDHRVRQVIAGTVTDQGVRQKELVDRLFEELLQANGLTRADIAGIVTTGYGRHMVDLADRAVTEITCHAVGVRHVRPETHTIIDIGGQDSKLIRLDGDGTVRDFVMNDRCAAGTGRFLEVVANRLEVKLENLGALASQSRSPATISSMCAVFAETEIVGLLASGVHPADIVAGVQASMATRIAAMAGRLIEEPVVFTGGVALVPGMTTALSKAFECPVTIAPNPRMTGALGAAILAART